MFINNLLQKLEKKQIILDVISKLKFKLILDGFKINLN
jgi:hypothetical protein